MISPITPPPMENTKPRFLNICYEGPPPAPYENWEDWGVDTFKNRTMQGVYIRALISGDFSFDKKEVATPPFELMNQWCKKACKDPYNGGKFIMAPVLKDISNAAAQWGADQELEACCEWLDFYSAASDARDLRLARRPEPPSKAESALNALEHILRHSLTDHGANTIRLALERLKDLEAAND